MMTNSAVWIWYSFFLSLFFAILSVLFFLFPEKTNGRLLRVLLGWGTNLPNLLLVICLQNL